MNWSWWLQNVTWVGQPEIRSVEATSHVLRCSHVTTCPLIHPLCHKAHHNQHKPQKTEGGEEKKRWGGGMPFSVCSEKGERESVRESVRVARLFFPWWSVTPHPPPPAPGPHSKGKCTHPLRICPPPRFNQIHHSSATSAEDGANVHNQQKSASRSTEGVSWFLEE